MLCEGSGYPGLMVTAETAGVTFPFANPYDNEGQIINWWYAIFADYTYFANIQFEVSPYIPIGTEIDFTLQTVTMGCYDESCPEDPYCHDCPLTEPVSFSLIVGDSFPNVMGDANIDGSLDILDVTVTINYILSAIEFTEENLMEFYLMDMNMDWDINVIDVVNIVDNILNN